MKLKHDKVYKVINGNTDGSVLVGDLIMLDGRSGQLVVPKGKGWLEKEELTPSVMDFECVPV